MYSVSKMKSDRKPPLAKSPMRLRPRRVLRPSNSCSLQTPSGSLIESKKPIRCQDIEESELRPEYRTISCELRALTKMVREELGKENFQNSASANSLHVNSGIVFERGRFYDEYSARRNERLKRKKTGDDGKAPVYNLGVAVESSKKSSFKKLESLRKSVSATYSVERSETGQYMLKSMNKRKKTRDDGKVLVYNLGEAVESAKKISSKKLESLRKSVSTAYSVEPSETPRYMLRSMTKGNKKLPPLP